MLFVEFRAKSYGCLTFFADSELKYRISSCIMQTGAFLLMACFTLGGCRAVAPTTAPVAVVPSVEQLRVPRMHQLDITFRSLEDIRIAAYRYNHLRFEVGQDIQADPPRNYVGIWCTDDELPGFIEKMRADNLFFKVLEAQ